MEKEPSHTRLPIEHEEISVLLRSLRIEATPEAHFEARFVYDFRERLAREAVCRPARSLMWEHLLQILSNLGGRRLAWSLSSFGVGALCMGVLFWQNGGSAKRALASNVYQLGGHEVELRPGAVHDMVSTNVQRTKNKTYTERLMGGRMSEPYYLAGLDEEGDAAGFHFSAPSADDADMSISLPALMPHLAH